MLMQSSSAVQRRGPGPGTELDAKQYDDLEEGQIRATRVARDAVNVGTHLGLILTL